MDLSIQALIMGLTQGLLAALVAASAPADMRGGGTVNADGFGVIWS